LLASVASVVVNKRSEQALLFANVTSVVVSIVVVSNRVLLLACVVSIVVYRGGERDDNE